MKSSFSKDRSGEQFSFTKKSLSQPWFLWCLCKGLWDMWEAGGGGGI